MKAIGSKLYLFFLGALFVGMAIGGPIAIFNGIQSTQAVDRFTSAPLCNSDSKSNNCYVLFPMTINKVSIYYARSGEEDTVQFISSGKFIKVTVKPGNLTASLIRTGASGQVKVWQKRYTDLLIGGTDFQTFQNPSEQRNDLLFAGILVTGVVFFLSLIGGSVIWSFGGFHKLTLLVSKSKLQSNPFAAISSATKSKEKTELPLMIRLVKPTMSFGRKLLFVFMFFVISSMFLTQSRSIGKASLLLLAMFLLGVVGTFIWQHLYYSNSSILVDTTKTSYTNFIGKTRSFSNKDVKKLIFRSISQSRGGPYPIAILSGTNNLVLLTLNGKTWTANELEKMDSALQGS